MKYIGGIHVDENKLVQVKRVSNQKWYNGDKLLIQIKEFLDKSENGLLRNQFFTEHKEITTLYSCLGLQIKKDAIYKPGKEFNL